MSTGCVISLESKANSQQLEAIYATEGPLLIIAGPGSGKTFTLVERIVYLITHKGVAPESLLVVTFTDKAARELTTRISNRLAELGIQFNLNEMYLGTFHSICLRLLEDYRGFTLPQSQPAGDRGTARRDEGRCRRARGHHQRVQRTALRRDHPAHVPPAPPPT